jgi:uncharacterized protein with HEPN domain
MRRERRFDDYLRDILDAARSAREFVRGVPLEDFRNNKEKVFAVVRAFEIIGEATKRLPKSFTARHPEVPWRRMDGY